MSEQTCTLSYRTCRNLPVSPTAFCWKIAPMQQPGNPLTSANRVRTHLRQKKTRCTSLSYKTIGSSSWLQHAMPLYFFRTFSRIVHPKKSAKASNQFIVFCSTLMCESWGCSSEDVSSDPLEIRNIRNQHVVWLPDSTVHCLGILSAKLLNHVTRSGHIIAHNDSQ